MANILKGNFTTAKSVSAETELKTDLESRFEREALKKLGGSISYVSKKRVKWTDNGAKE